MTNPENREQTTEIVTPPINYREQTTEIVISLPGSKTDEGRPDSTRFILPGESITKKNPYVGTRETREIAKEMGASMGLQHTGGSVELNVVMIRDGKKYHIPGNGNLPKCRVRYRLSSYEGRLYASPEDPEKNPLTIGQFVETELGLSFKKMETVFIDVEGTSNKSFDPEKVPSKGTKNTESGWLEKLANEGKEEKDPNKTNSTAVRKTKKGLSARFDTSP